MDQPSSTPSPTRSGWGGGIFISQALLGLCKGSSLCQDSLIPNLCIASLFLLCHKEVCFKPLLWEAFSENACPLAQLPRHFLLDSGQSLHPANQTLLGFRLLFCFYFPAQVIGYQLCKGRAPIAQVLISQTPAECSLVHSAHWAMTASPATLYGLPTSSVPASSLAPHLIGVSPLSRNGCVMSSCGGTLVSPATGHWLSSVPTHPPTQAGPRLFIMQVRTPGAEAFPTPRSELSRPQLSKNRLRRAHAL